MEAISFKPQIAEAVSLKDFKKGSRRLTTEEKRVRFVLSSAQELRDKWVSARRA
jgi:hypothetical protein